MTPVLPAAPGRRRPVGTSACQRAGNCARAFLRARSGATAVEFGLLALPFLALVGASLEAGITYFGQEILQQAVVEAGRQVYTGRFQTTNAGTTNTDTLASNLRTAVCYSGTRARTTTFDCSRIRISLTQADSFGTAAAVAATVTDPRTGISDWNPSFPSYVCARSNAIMVFQVAVDVPVYFPLLGAAYATLPGNRRVLQAATVFQVEPYNSNAACPASS